MRFICFCDYLIIYYDSIRDDNISIQMSDGMSDDDDFIPPTRVRMISLGDSGSGKSALIKRHCEKRFVGHYVQTIGIDYGAIKIKRDWHQQSQEDVSIAIFDVGGHELFYQVRKVVFNQI